MKRFTATKDAQNDLAAIGSAAGDIIKQIADAFEEISSIVNDLPEASDIDITLNGLAQDFDDNNPDYAGSADKLLKQVTGLVNAYAEVRTAIWSLNKRLKTL